MALDSSAETARGGDGAGIGFKGWNCGKYFQYVGGREGGRQAGREGGRRGGRTDVGSPRSESAGVAAREDSLVTWSFCQSAEEEIKTLQFGRG